MESSASTPASIDPVAVLAGILNDENGFRHLSAVLQLHPQLGSAVVNDLTRQLGVEVQAQLAALAALRARSASIAEEATVFSASIASSLASIEENKANFRKAWLLTNTVNFLDFMRLGCLQQGIHSVGLPTDQRNIGPYSVTQLETGTLCLEHSGFKFYLGPLNSLVPLASDCPLLDLRYITGIGVPTNMSGAGQGSDFGQATPSAHGPVIPGPGHDQGPSRGLLGNCPPGLSGPNTSVVRSSSLEVTNELVNLLNSLQGRQTIGTAASAAGSGTKRVPEEMEKSSSVSSSSSSWSQVVSQPKQARVDPLNGRRSIGSTDFVLAEDSQHVRDINLPNEVWKILNFERDLLIEADKKFEKMTGSHVRGDLPFPDEHFYDFRAMTPSDLSAKVNCTLKEDNGRSKVILLTDSVGAHVRFVCPGNCFVATFGSDGEWVPTRFPQTNFTTLTQGLEYDLGVVAISGLGAVYGKSYSPDILHDKICGIFGLDRDWRPDLLGFRLGTNDLKSYLRSSRTGSYSTADVEEGEASSTEELIDKICQFGKDLSVAFNGAPVAWMGSGCPAINLPAAPLGMEMKYHYFPRTAHVVQKKKLDDMLSHLVALLEEKGRASFQEVVSSDGLGTVIGKFCIFPSVSPINPSMSGSGHVNARDMGKFVGNMLNTLGILLCKVRAKNDVVLRFLCRAGIPARWNDQLEVIPHGQHCWLKPEDTMLVDKLPLKKQADWVDCVCREQEEYPAPARNFSDVAGETVDFRFGQLVRVHPGNNDSDGLGEGGMVVCHHGEKTKALVFLFHDRKVHEVLTENIRVMFAWLHVLYSEKRAEFQEQAKNKKLHKKSFKRSNRGRK